jgi:hypothetical protein
MKNTHNFFFLNYFLFCWFSTKLFNIEYFLHHSSKHYELLQCTLPKSRAFQQYQVHGNGTVVWKISMWLVTTKQKEQHSLIDRLDFEFLFNLQMVL